MTGPHPSTPPQTSARPYACAACGRRFVVVGPPAHGHTGPRCACGAVLAEAPLPSGVYEIRKSRRASRRRPSGRNVAGASPSHASVPPMPHEPDLGYGESHGYGPAHGGPSGPGDAPAIEPSGEALHRPDEDPSAPRS